MLQYSEIEIKEIIESILNRTDFQIEPVGNHHLNRHLVYKIIFLVEKPLVFKLYYRTRRRSREIASLKLLEDSTVKCPQIYKYGILKDGSEWLMMDFIEGELFDRIISKVSHAEKIKLFEQMGEELGKLHACKTFDFFGEWDEEGRSIENIQSYHDRFVKSMEQSIAEIIKQKLPDEEILMAAIESIRQNYSIFNICTAARLVHHDFDGRNILVRKEEKGYVLGGIIDFEGAYPDNSEENLVALYHRYFLENKEYEKAFLEGYGKYMTLDDEFYKRLPIYLLSRIVGNCSWAHWQAPEYYKENIEFLHKIFERK